MDADELDALLAQLKASRKYGDLCEGTLRRVLEWSAARYSGAQVEKAAKRKLHQVYGAYLSGLDLPRLESWVETMRRTEDPEAIKDLCRRVLSCHASTAERLPMLDELYPALFQTTGTPRRVLDLACGLHPFGLPWMGLPDGAVYHAVDLNVRLLACVQGFLQSRKVAGTAQCGDVLLDAEYPPADVVLLLKTLPCLERQEEGASLRLLSRLPARYAVVSFPTRSLGGRSKGMRENYARFLHDLAGQLGAPLVRLDYAGEMFGVIELAAAGNRV